MSKAEIILQMRRVSDAMKQLGNDMTAIPDKDWVSHGLQLHSAGEMLAQWQAAAEKEKNGRD